MEHSDKLIVHKLSSLLSQSSVKKLLNKFISSKDAEVCLLLANMQETSPKIINHIRLMIEEEELKSQGQCKIFVLLLHFPPAKFFQHCYPVLFLKGWDHYYLDTIGYTSIKGVLDIQDWFLKCCFPSKSDASEPDALLKTISELLHQIIPSLSAHVNFGNKNDKSFNSSMSATQRSAAIKEILFEQGLGPVICKKFRAYWNSKVMTEYLEKAAIFSKRAESTLNITDTIQTQFKSLFIDFCVYMLTRANKNFNLDIIYDKKSPQYLRSLFINIFELFPVPKLEQLSILSSNLPNQRTPIYTPQFPFFDFICDHMDKKVELNNESANLKMNLLADKAGSTCSSFEAKLEALTAAVLTSLGTESVSMPRIVVLLVQSNSFLYS